MIIDSLFVSACTIYFYKLLLFMILLNQEMVCIGIDLGTTYSCAAIVENDRPVAIHNEDGKINKLLINIQ